MPKVQRLPASALLWYVLLSTCTTCYPRVAAVQLREKQEFQLNARSLEELVVPVRAAKDSFSVPDKQPCEKGSPCGELPACSGIGCLFVRSWNRILKDPYEVLCTILIFFSATLAASAGTGGGGMFVPLLLLFSDLKSELTVPLSQSMILCSSLANLACFVSQRHPVAVAHAKIDYDCIVLLEPMLCFGVTLGVVVHRLAPHWLLVAMLCLTLGSAFWRTSQKGLKQMCEERANSWNGEYEPACGENKLALLERWSQYFNACKDLISLNSAQVLGISSVWFAMLLASCHGLPIGSLRYMVYLFVLGAFLVTCTGMIARMLAQAHSIAAIEPSLALSNSAPTAKLLAKDEIKSFELEESEFAHGEKRSFSTKPIDWVTNTSLQSCLRFPSVAFLAGLVGGSLGLGGGIIVSPMLLEVGMHSEAVQATTAAFVFLSSSLATIQYIILDQVVWEYAIWYGFLAIAATALGQHLCEVYVRRHKRYSAITLSIAGVLLFSLIALVLVGIRDFINEEFQVRNVDTRVARL